MKVFLVGLPGSGKSWLGKKVSKSLNLPFIDLDKVLEEQEGKPIRKIFADHGKDYFRTIEAKALREQCKGGDFVMATGGGTPAFYGNMELMNSVGTSVYIDTPIDVIVSRMDSNEVSTRPLLMQSPDQKIEDTLQQLLTLREKYYQQAHYTINGAKATGWDIVNLLFK